MSMSCKLTKVKGGAAVRTDTVKGVCEIGPVEGFPFEMLAQSLDPAMDVRMVTTSRIVSLQKKSRARLCLGREKPVDVLTFTATTESGSVYEIEVET